MHKKIFSSAVALTLLLISFVVVAALFKYILPPSFLLLIYSVFLESGVTTIVSQIALIFLAVTVPTFVFTVTLLGPAAEIAKEESIKVELENNKIFTEQIAKLRKDLSSPDRADIAELKKEIYELEEKKLFNDRKVDRVLDKYSYLGLKKAVVLPSALFLISILFSTVIVWLSPTQFLKLVSVTASIWAIIWGISGILKTLNVVQEITPLADSRKAQREKYLLAEITRISAADKKTLTKALSDALGSLEKSKLPKLLISTIEKSPIIIKKDVDSEINIAVSLDPDGGVEAKDINIWFMSSPEVSILPGVYEMNAPQGADYVIPRANTAIARKSSLRGSIWNAVVRIKATSKGNFKARIAGDCEGYAPPDSEDVLIDIIVQE